MRIEVTEEDIQNGISKSFHYCPIALALKRHSEKNRASATCSVLTLDARYFRTPESARDFIIKFDMCESVVPFSFDLEDSDFLYIARFISVD